MISTKLHFCDSFPKISQLNYSHPSQIQSNIEHRQNSKDDFSDVDFALGYTCGERATNEENSKYHLFADFCEELTIAFYSALLNRSSPRIYPCFCANLLNRRSIYDNWLRGGEIVKILFLGGNHTLTNGFGYDIAA
jgi:hypothetical protein